MRSVQGYTLVARVFESDRTIVERGVRTSDGRPVIVKTLRNPYPPPGELARLRDEHALLQLLQTAAAVRAFELLNSDNGLALVLEDLGDSSVSKALGSALEIGAFLDLAVAMADALQSIHSAGVIHGDVAPHHFFLAEVEPKMRLIDFGLSVRLSPHVRAVAATRLEGTLAYISPERTGRMNRLVDCRSDQYGLGVTFYQLLTGSLPFETTDPLELVHSHIARRPRPVLELRPDVPPVLGEIIAKLLSKMAEERYHTVAGLASDLRRCRATLSADGRIPSFPIAEDDAGGELTLPQKLYGREGASAAIEQAAERVQRGAAELLTITGPSGVGKSAVVREIEKHLRSGRFVSGKFDQLARGLPYSAVIHACRQLLRGVLADPADRVAAIRGRLLHALGPNAGLLGDVLPELALVIGPQPEAPPIGPIEAQSRFERAFQAFLLAFARPEYPLALFLDDLQWADPASLRLLHLLLTASDGGYLLVLGAYRDNEVDTMHPLSVALAELRGAGLAPGVLALAPLTTEDVAQFLGDTLELAPSEVGSLTALLMRKTDGNPFYLRQLLIHLHANGLVAWDVPTKRWRWDEQRVAAEAATDNVVDFMIGKLNGLPGRTRDLLRLAACVGHEFDLDTLASIAGRSAADVGTDLQVALDQGLIVATARDDVGRLGSDRISGEHAGSGYRFLHDRVQQAAYALIETENKLRIHLRIGRSLAEGLGGRASEEALFAAVNHLDIALPLIEGRDERLRLAGLNLEAGRRALGAAAHATAAALLDVAIALFEEDAWASDRDGAREAHLMRATCAFLTSDFDLAHRLLARLEADSRTLLERTAGRAFEVVVLTGQNLVQEAAAHAVETARQLGLDLPSDPAEIGAAIGPAFGELQGLLAAHTDESLLGLPAMTDPEKLALMDLVFRAFPALYQANAPLAVLVNLRTMTMQIRHGNSPTAPFSYANYGVVHARATGDFDGGHRFGQLALRLAARLQNRAVDGATYFIVGSFVTHWRTHLRDSVALLRTGLKLSFEGGDGAHAGYCAMVGSIYSFFAGKPLEDALAELASIEGLLLRNGNVINAHYVRIQGQTAQNLLGRTRHRSSLDGGGFDEAEFLRTAGTHPSLRHTFWLCKQLVHYVHGDFAESLTAAERGLPVAPAFFMEGLYDYLRALAIAGVLRRGEAAGRDALLAQLTELEERHRRWAAANPANSGARHALIAAELAAAQGRRDAASDLYDEAIRSAREHGFVYCEAFASELAGRFHGARGRHRIASSYLADAHHAYLRWGATSKASELAAEYPELAAPVARPSDVSMSQSLRSTVSGNLDLDLLTAIRATQAIGAELDLERLVERVLRVLTENAGAQRGLFVLREGETFQLVAEAQLSAESIATRLAEPVEGSARLAAGVVQLAVRSREVVALADAAADPRFARDTYVAERHPRSLLCVPLLHQGRVTGAVYFENNTASHVFDPARVELVHLLAAQAATAVENARLYGEVKAAGERLRGANATLEQKVAERTRELAQRNRALRVVLDNVDQGLFGVDLGGRVLEERSAIVERWFGRGEGSPDLAAYVGADPRFAETFTLGMEALRDAVLPLDLCIDQLPGHLVARGRHFDCRYLPIEDAGILQGLLCVLDDVTEQLKRAHEEAEQRELVAAFTAFARDRAGFLVFFHEAEDILRELRSADLDLVTRKRLLHTLKGNAGIPGLGGIAELCHRAESELDELGVVGAATMESLQHRWTVLAQALGGVIGAENRNVIEVSDADIADLARRVEGGIAPRELLAEVVRLRWEPLERPLSRLAEHGRALARRLKQAEIDIQVHADRVRLDPERWYPLWSALVHVIRNAVDHGLESAEARAASGKPGRGLLRLEGRAANGELRLEIEDDGCGIDWDTVRRLCQRRGLACQTRADLVEALLRPDFSSREQVSETSGRGVGMAAVAACVSERGGILAVESEPGRGTRWVLKLPLEPVSPVIAAPPRSAPAFVATSSAAAGR